MQSKIYVPPLGRVARTADALMVPVMYLVSGTLSEKPQRTHRWNYRKIPIEKTFALDRAQMISHPGIPSEGARWGIRFHIPILNGWKKYVVLQPVEPGKPWHVGWSTTNKHGFNCGVSRIPVFGAVRMLIGPEKVWFFGVATDRFTQIALEEVGQDSIGSSGPYAAMPLL